MTHGEEPGPETHQDSAVLTYLEGLLMHQVAGGQGATATQSGSQEQRNKEGRGHAQSNHVTQQEQNRTNSHCGASQHLRKARLLNSEAWTESESQKRSAPNVALNGQNEDRHSGQNGSSQDKGESTLLASLLQSFSSRLQNVTLPQQIIQGLRPQDTSCLISKSPQEQRTDGPYHRPASSHLKELVSKSKMTNHSSVPYQRRRSSQESFSESPKALKSSTPSPSPESLSCTERLKAVANLVNIRSSPAPSPKPSVACSQLALLLSSEAHLQQYTREHALKAKLSGRLASERLSAMATQQIQDKKQPTTSSQTQGLSLLHAQNGIPSQMSTSSSRQSPSLALGQRRSEGSMRAGHRFKERRPFEKPGRPSQNCSSLLLQLLNSHNTSHRINGQGHLKDDFSTFGTLSSPLFSDSEHSNPDSSYTKDSSDAESTYSSCSPMDLSLKTRTHVKTPVSTSSSPALERIQDCSLNRWNRPDSLPVTVTMDHREVDACSEMKPHHKVTLLQLLLDHKNNERVNKGLDNPDLLRAVIPNVTSASTSSQSVFSTTRCKDTNELNSHCGLNCRSPKLVSTFAQSKDSNSSVPQYTVYGSPHSQSVPLDLCKTKQPSSEIKEPAFSASKLLQNLAQCGKQSPTISPPIKAPLPPIKLMTQELKVNHPATLLERLTAPIQRNDNLLRDEAKAKTVPETMQHVSEIENLLERRTVLQLLLGNASQKEKLSSKRKRDHGRSNSIDKQVNQAIVQDAANGPSLKISIKTEPVEDGQMYDYNKMSKQCQNLVLEPKIRSSYLSHGNIKQEPLSPEAAPRDGILCHLLKKRPNKPLQPNKVDDLNKSCIKEESVEIQRPTIPKKRKFSKELEDHDTSSQQDGYVERSGSINDNSSCSAAVDQEASDPSSPPEADSPPARFPPYESNENRGFNVLKQLLLSDNCLKELSQPRGTFSSPSHTVLNGKTIKQSCNEGELQNFHQSLSPSNVISKRASTLRPESPHVTHQELLRSKIDYTTIKDLKCPAKMVNGDGQTQKYEADLPRFTKTNPILYYMLQRSNAHLVKEGKELDADEGKILTKVKNGSSGDTEAFEL